MNLRRLLLFSGLLVSHTLHADAFVNWHSSNVQLLKGHSYALGDNDRHVVTFEHANTWRYGDFFSFLDWTKPDTGSSDYYMEFSPRFSLNKLSGRDYSLGPINDVSVAITVEKPKSVSARVGYGIGTSLAVPTFDFVDFNVYARDDPNLSGTTHQVTVAWKNTFMIGDSNWVFEGFADIVGAEGNRSSNTLFAPRLLVDFGKLMGLHRHNRLWAGVEYSRWVNKFGIANVDESVVQMQVMWVLH